MARTKFKPLKKNRGNKPKSKQALFSSPYTNPTQYLPRWITTNDIPEEIIKPYERLQGIQLGRDIFAKMPIISAAVLNKNHIAVGNAWKPTFGGDIRNEKDLAWAIAAENWLINEYYPNVNWNGQNFSFNDTLVITGKDIDVDGGSLMIYRNTKGGLPRIQLIPTDRIGSRDTATTVKGGSYDGYKIYDGIIYNSDNMPVAYQILGNTKETDEIISAFNCQYIFEPAWTSAGHGISRVSYSVTNLMDIQDINELLKITIKNFSAQGIIHSNSKGAAPKGKRLTAIETVAQSNAVEGSTNKVFFESVNKGGTQFISSTDGSEIKPFDFNRPSPQTEAFIFRIASESIASMGWFIELVCPQKLNGTSTRLIQDQARKLIIWRQQTLERRAKAIVQYGLASAMKLGLIPQTDNKTWMRWNFNKPGELTVDSGYDNTAQIESLKMGISTKEEICARRGKDWKQVSNQSEVEIRDLFSRAQKLAKDFSITFGEACEWLSKRDIASVAPSQPEPMAGEDTTNSETV